MSLDDADAVFPDDRRVEDWMGESHLKAVVFQPLQDDLVLVDRPDDGDSTSVRFARTESDDGDGPVGVAYVQPDPDMDRVYVVDPDHLVDYAERFLEEDGFDHDWEVKTIDDDAHELIAARIDERHLP